MERLLPTDIPLNPLLLRRYSPRAFSNSPVDKEILHRIFEAARWSASCNNEQPWRFIVGTKNNGNTYQKIYECLTDANKRWTIHAPVLILICAATSFSYKGRSNPWHMYDAGQSAVHITMQALYEGIQVHQMAGFDQQKATTTFAIPPEYVVASAMAMGYAGDPAMLENDLREKETAPRIRKPLNDMVFSGTWGNTCDCM
jgi:nitroreductase